MKESFMVKNNVFTVVINFHSWDKIKRLNTPNLIVIDNDKNNIGFAAGVNVGIKKALKAGADAVLLLNPDVKISSAQIEKLASTAGDVISPILSFSRQGQKILDFGGKVNWLLGRPTHWENRQGKIDYVSGACMLINKQVFEKIGFFDERFFMYFEDIDFCLRARDAGFKAVVNPKVIVRHNITEQRYSQDKFKIWQNLRSNFLFINKWVPWYFRPMAYLYLVLISLKIIFSSLIVGFSTRR